MNKQCGCGGGGFGLGQRDVCVCSHVLEQIPFGVLSIWCIYIVCLWMKDRRLVVRIPGVDFVFGYIHNTDTHIQIYVDKRAFEQYLRDY